MKLIKKSVSVILAILMLISVFSAAVFISNAADGSKSLSGTQVNPTVKANWDKLKDFLSKQTNWEYSYYYDFATIDQKASMRIIDNLVYFYYYIETEEFKKELSIEEVDINTPSTVKGKIYRDCNDTSPSVVFTIIEGDYSVGLENCYNLSENNISNIYGLSGLGEYTPNTQEFQGAFNECTEEIERLLLKPAVNLTLEDLGFGVPAVPESETTKPET